MSNNSDQMFDRYADLDLADAKAVREVPTLAKLQAAHDLSLTRSSTSSCKDITPPPNPATA